MKPVAKTSWNKSFRTTFRSLLRDVLIFPVFIARLLRRLGNPVLHAKKRKTLSLSHEKCLIMDDECRSASQQSRFMRPKIDANGGLISRILSALFSIAKGRVSANSSQRKGDRQMLILFLRVRTFRSRIAPLTNRKPLIKVSEIADRGTSRVLRGLRRFCTFFSLEASRARMLSTDSRYRVIE